MGLTLNWRWNRDEGRNMKRSLVHWRSTCMVTSLLQLPQPCTNLCRKCSRVLSVPFRKRFQNLKPCPEHTSQFPEQIERDPHQPQKVWKKKKKRKRQQKNYSYHYETAMNSPQVCFLKVLLFATCLLEIVSHWHSRISIQDTLFFFLQVTSKHKFASQPHSWWDRSWMLPFHHWGPSM